MYLECSNGPYLLYTTPSTDEYRSWQFSLGDKLLLAELTLFLSKWRIESNQNYYNIQEIEGTVRLESVCYRTHMVLCIHSYQHIQNRLSSTRVHFRISLCIKFKQKQIYLQSIETFLGTFHANMAVLVVVRRTAWNAPPLKPMSSSISSCSWHC